MKRCFTLFFVVLTVFLIACTSDQESASLQEPSEQDTLDQARTQLTNEDCELKETAFEKEDCYYQKAVIFEDAGFCEKIEDIENFGTKIQCVNALKNCEELSTTEEKDGCYSEKTISRNNVAKTFGFTSGYLTQYCDKISDSTIKDGCFLQIATLWSEPNFCERMSGKISEAYGGQMTPGLCYSEVAKMGYVNLDICEKISLSETSTFEIMDCWRNVMLTKIACITTQKEASGTYCPFNSYEAAEGINEYDKQAVATLDESKCASIQTTLSQEGCYGIVAIKKGDKTICDNIQTPALKNQCTIFVESVYI